MNYLNESRTKAITQISLLMLAFLVASMIANALNGRITFVGVYAATFIATALHLWRFRRTHESESAAQRLIIILYVLFFSFFFIGEHATFDILWVLILPIVTIILGDFAKTQAWLVAFNLLLLAMLVLHYFDPTLILYEGFAMWSMLWAGIFLSGMAIYYKKVQGRLQESIQEYHTDLESKIARSVEQIQDLRIQKAQADYHLVQSRLASLERQLNPHFLFNALNSIAELLHHDIDKAETAILQVSTFLRNTMKEQTQLPLVDELRHVQDYVALENIRFGNAIKLHLPSSIPTWSVPKFSIQLLVENAIKHGYDARQKELTITIAIDEAQGIITVSNDGLPMPTTQLGIGLGNLDQRLGLLCQGKLVIVSTHPPALAIHLGACHETTHR